MLNFFELSTYKFGKKNIKLRAFYESDSEIESDNDSEDENKEDIMMVAEGNNFYFDFFNCYDIFKKRVSHENEIHDRHDYFFFPFKYVMEIDSYIIPFKKNIVYRFDNFINPFLESEDIINFAKPYLDNIIKFYEKYSSNDPIIKGHYAIIIQSYDKSGFTIDKFEKVIDQKNNKVLYETPENRPRCVILKGEKFKIKLAVDIYTDYPREDYCISCSKNKSNILFSSCQCMVICLECLYKNKEKTMFINSCPLCNNTIELPIKIDLPI